MHVHVAGLGAKGSGCYVSKPLREDLRFDHYLKAFSVSSEELKEQGDSVLFKKLSATIKDARFVDAAIVLALDGVVNEKRQLDLNQTEVYIPNDFVAQETKKYDNLYFGASINPYRSDALDRLTLVKQQGAKLVKWIPSIQMIDPGDARLVPFYQKLKQLRIPLLTHTGRERSFSKARDELADPLRLKLPLDVGVTVIAAHVATTGKTEGEDNMQRLLPMFEQYSNLYADISSLTQINKLGYLKRILANQKIHDRLVYGSDFPLINTLLVSAFYFPLNMTVSEMYSIDQVSNPWDRDVLLKQALGTPTGVFARSRELLLR